MEFEITDKGTLKVISKNADKAVKSTDKLTKSTKNLSKAKSGLNVKQNQNNKLEKGTAGLTSNSTKAFSKQAQTLGGTLVPAYATLAANIFALTAAFGALQRAAAFEQLQQGLVLVGNTAGQNLPFIAQQLKDITGAAVSAQSAMSAVALGVSSGFDTGQLKELTKVAKGASLALGRNMEDALSRLVRGTAKVEPEILDELGIMVRLDAAVQKYAVTLGKSANQLTQFERSQAFLNATIDEGISKFAFVADSVDANPYDKLSASFDDLSKSGFKLLNKVLGPIVEILASNPTALLGVLTLFAGTLISKIVPGLNEMVNKQRQFSAAAAAQAKASAHIISASYTKALAEVNAAFKTVPPSIEKMRASLLSGKLTTQEYTVAVRNLKLSEQLRASALLNHTGKILTLKQKELQQTTELRLAVERLQVAEKTRYQINKAGAIAHAASLQSRVQASTLGSIDNSNAFVGFKRAGEGAVKQLHIIRRTGVSSAAAIGVAFKGASLAVGLMGRALLNAIPAIGLITLAASVLAPLWDTVFGGSAVDKASKKAIDALESIDGIAEQLAVTLGTSTKATDKYAAALNVQVGVMKQVLAGFKAIYDVQLQEAMKERVKLLKEEHALMVKLSEIKGNAYADTGTGRARATSTKGALASVRNDIAENDKGLKSIGLDATLELIETGLYKMQFRSGAAQEALSGVAASLTELKQEALAAGEGTNTVEFKDIYAKGQALIHQEEVIVNALKNSKDAVGLFNKEVNKLANKKLTPFDSVIDSVVALNKELKGASLGKDGALGTMKFLEDNPDLYEKLKKLQFPDAPTSFGEAMRQLAEFNPLDTMDKLEEGLIKQRDVVLSTKGTLIELKAEHSALRAIAANNATIMEVSIGKEQEILKTIIRRLEAEKDINEKLEVQHAKQKEIDGVTRKLALLTGEKSLRIKIAGVRAQQREHSLVVKRLAAERQYLTALIQKGKIIQKQRYDRVGADVTAGAALTEFNKTKDARLKMEDKALVTRLMGIDLEFELLRLKITLEDRKARAEGHVITEYAELINKANALQTSTRNAALKSAEANAQGIEGSGDSLARSAVSEALAKQAEDAAISIERLALASERYEVASNSALSTAQDIVVANAELAQSKVAQQIADDKLTRAKKESLDWSVEETAAAQAKLEVDEAALEVLKTTVAHMRDLATTVETAFGEGSASAFSFFANLSASAKIYESDLFSVSDKIKQMGIDTKPFIDNLKALGPEGEFIAQLVDASFVMVEVWSTALETLGNTSASTADRMAAGFAAAASSVSALASVLAAQSAANISRIDQEIEAEKKRDGKSAASVARLAQLDKKKDAQKKKSFEVNKKLMLASAVMSTAAGIAGALAQTATLGPFAIALAALIGVMGAAQIAIISGTSYQGGTAAGASVPSSVSVGERANKVDLASSRSSSGELGYMRGEQGVGNTGAANFIPTGAFAGNRSSGGNTAYEVGEQGPELFIPDRPGSIIPADDVENIGNASNVTFNINAVDAAGIEDMLIGQRGNIIGMIREAANSHGEFFLEQVNVHEDDARR